VALPCCNYNCKALARYTAPKDMDNKKDILKNIIIKIQERKYMKFSAVLYLTKSPVCFKRTANPPKNFVCWGFKKVAIIKAKKV
jgi:tRNA(Ile2) C34 agmatinyltransferase TiaS